MNQIKFTDEADEDLDENRKYDQRRIILAIESQLTDQADRPTRNRKRLRPNSLAEWELRIENIWVFYDVIAEEGVVKIIAIGQKENNKLYIRGEEYDL